MQLRPYQQEALAAFDAAVSGGMKRPLIVLPTGAGKTVIFSRLAKRPNGKKALVLAHRQELLDQAASKITAANPDLWVEIEQAERRASPMANCVVASVQTIGREGSSRIEKFDPNEFDLVIVDEAHHAVAPSYRMIFDRFGVGQPGGPTLLGVTATPNRGDGSALGEVFDSIIYQKSILEMIEEGWLCNVRAFTVQTAVSIADVHTKAGEFVASELADAVDKDDRNLQIVRAWMELAKGRKRTLAFTVNVAHAHHLAAMFKAHEIECAVVTGETPNEQRKGILAAFERAELPLLANCAVLTEGYDCPGIDCILWGRPTKSVSLLAQCLGRGTRKHPDKEELLFLDFVDTTGKHKIATVASLFGMPAKLKMRAEKITDAVKKVSELQGDLPSLSEEELTLAQLERKVAKLKELAKKGALQATVSATEVALFAAREVDPFVKQHSGLGWVKMTEGCYQLPAGDAGYVRIQQNLLGHYEVQVMPKKEQLGTFADAKDAFRNGDLWLSTRFPTKAKFLDQSAGWRADAASPKQVAELKKRGVPIPPGLTKGDAANMLNAVFAQRADDMDGPPTNGQAWFLRGRGLDPRQFTKRTASMKIRELKGISRGAA